MAGSPARAAREGPVSAPDRDVHGRDRQRSLHVCRDKAVLLPEGAKPHRTRSLQREATGVVMEVTKWLKPSVQQRSRYAGKGSRTWEL